MSTNPATFWDYSLAVYSQEDVVEACLGLQNQYGFDVNLVLFCLWYGDTFATPMPQSLLSEAIKLSSHWSDVSVQPLRRIRTEIKQDGQLQQLNAASAINTLREKVKSLELLAEKIQQSLLEELAHTYAANHSAPQKNNTSVGETANCQRNLMRLTAAMKLDPEPALESILTAVLNHRHSGSG